MSVERRGPSLSHKTRNADHPADLAGLGGTTCASESRFSCELQAMLALPNPTVQNRAVRIRSPMGVRMDASVGALGSRVRG